MSDSRDREEEDFLRSGEYVLGLGDAAERHALESEMDGNPALRQAVAAWQGWLSPLWAGFQPVNPPPALWTRIEQTLSRTSRRRSTGERVAPARPARSTRDRWIAGAVGFALAAGIAAVAFLARPPAPLPTPVTALIPKTAGLPLVIGERAAGGSLVFRSVGALTTPTGKDYELWSLPAGARRPVAIGLLHSGTALVAADHLMAGRSEILVSLEPRGGSPTSLPTGPVLWGGAYEKQ